jgi:hypothetical protein
MAAPTASFQFLWLAETWNLGMESCKGFRLRNVPLALIMNDYLSCPAWLACLAQLPSTWPARAHPCLVNPASWLRARGIRRQSLRCCASCAGWARRKDVWLCGGMRTASRAAPETALLASVACGRKCNRRCLQQPVLALLPLARFTREASLDWPR